MDNISHTFKICLVGDAGVGKTTLLKRMRGLEFERMYIPTTGVEVHPLYFDTDHGRIRLNIWDCAGQVKYSGLIEGYFVNSDGAILMYDSSSRLSHNSIQSWSTSFNKFVIVSNKADYDEQKVKLDDIRVSSKDMTVDELYNAIFKPLIDLLV